VGAELFHADDGQTDKDMTNLTVAFRNFANAPNKTRGKKHNTLNVTYFEILYPQLQYMPITPNLKLGSIIKLVAENA
jgi:hypothetical protein